ncbi:hypothetical protein [Paenibacillus sp. GCM10027626]
MPSPEALGTVSDYFKHHHAMMGYTLLDEPSADEFPGVEKVSFIWSTVQ